MSQGKPKIITFSGKARAGKDSSADMLMGRLIRDNYKVAKIAYGDYVKYLAKQYFNWNGEKDIEGRTILQWLGTDNVRNKSPNFWVDNVILLVETLFFDYDFILISDCRFPNEIGRWIERDYDVSSVLVERPGHCNSLTSSQKKHLSETALDNFPFEHILKAADINELSNEVDKFLKILTFN